MSAEPAQGPYRALISQRGWDHMIRTPNGHLVAMVNTFDSSYEEAEATAHLLAASWQMREALEALDESFALALLEDDPEPEDDRLAAVKLAYEALKAARGEQP